MTPKVGQRVMVPSRWFCPWLGRKIDCFREAVVTKTEPMSDVLERELTTWQKKRRGTDPAFAREFKLVKDALDAFFTSDKGRKRTAKRP